VRFQSVRAAAVVAAAALLLGSCTSDGDNSDDGKRAGCDTGKGTLAVGVIAPLSGEHLAKGRGIENATRLAVDQANRTCAVDGYKLTVQIQDDGTNPKLGAQAATLLASTPNVIGVVSTVSSSVAAAVAPVLDRAGILQISPANTSDQLTRGADHRRNPKRQFDTYFRTCSLDSLQGPFAAKYLVEKVKKKNIAVVADGSPYGEGLAETFIEKAEELGATIATRQRIAPGTKDFVKLVAALRPFGPDAVYVGGHYPEAAPMSAQLAAAGLKVPVMGGDGIFHPAYLTSGGRNGDLATSAGAPAAELDSAKEFVKAYQKAGYKDGFDAHGAFAYDAANVIIGALAETVGDGKWSDSMRDKLVANAGKYEEDGATGRVSFDEFGDTRNRILTVHEQRDGKWTAIETGEYTD
jgi:branched-chain amino acid transport system substrate-binding protein